MAYYLTNLLQDALRSLGKTERFIATGGSASTVANAALGELAIKDRPKNKDVIGSYLFCSRDAGGAGAAPEGQFKRVSRFVAASYTYGISSNESNFTAAITAGDEMVLVDPEFPIPDMIMAVNDYITKILYVPAPDTSLVTVANQQNYSLPIAAKLERPLSVEIQTVAGDDETYQFYDHYEYIPTATASAGVLHFFENPTAAGLSIRITYRTYHPALTVYNSEIDEKIPKELAKLAAKVGILEWYTGRNDDDPESPWPRKLDVARSDLDIAMKEHNRIWAPHKRQNYIPIPGVSTYT